MHQRVKIISSPQKASDQIPPQKNRKTKNGYLASHYIWHLFQPAHERSLNKCSHYFCDIFQREKKETRLKSLQRKQKPSTSIQNTKQGDSLCLFLSAGIFILLNLITETFCWYAGCSPPLFSHFSSGLFSWDNVWMTV